VTYIFKLKNIEIEKVVSVGILSFSLTQRFQSFVLIRNLIVNDGTVQEQRLVCSSKAEIDDFLDSDPMASEMRLELAKLKTDVNRMVELKNGSFATDTYARA
jgi:hypothetical protein